MPKRQEGGKKARKALDRVSAKALSKGQKAKQSKAGAKTQAVSSTKKSRGRPHKVPVNWVTGRAYNYGIQLQQAWPRLEAPLLAAKTVEEVRAAFESYGQPYANSFVPELAEDILVLTRHRRFPKRAEGQIHFLADSLGGRPNLSLRTSRDTCERERARLRRKSRHRIIRHEFYVECSCGYKGPARDNACRKCSAVIPIFNYEL